MSLFDVLPLLQSAWTQGVALFTQTYAAAKPHVLAIIDLIEGKTLVDATSPALVAPASLDPALDAAAA